MTARHFLWDEPSQSSLRDARFPLLSPAVTSVPLFVTYGDISPRPGRICPGRGKSFLSGGSCRSRRLRGFSRDKNSVENCNFPRLFHTEKRQRPGVENLGPAIPDWRKINRRSGTVCRMQRKSFDFLFYKRQNACIFIQNFPESGCLNYGAYRADPFLLLKTQWKKWKTSRKTRPFLHKSG